MSAWFLDSKLSTYFSMYVLPYTVQPEIFEWKIFKIVLCDVCQTLYVTGSGKSRHLQTRINIQKYVIQLFNKLYFKNAWSCLYEFPLLYSHQRYVFQFMNSSMSGQLNCPPLQMVFHQNHKCLHSYIGGDWLGATAVEGKNT